jgi:hypothetical protein
LRVLFGDSVGEFFDLSVVFGEFFGEFGVEFFLRGSVCSAILALSFTPRPLRLATSSSNSSVNSSEISPSDSGPGSVISYSDSGSCWSVLTYCLFLVMIGFGVGDSDSKFFCYTCLI